MTGSIPFLLAVSLASATEALQRAQRLEEGLPGSIEVVRSVTSLEDALQLIAEEAGEPEEA